MRHDAYSHSKPVRYVLSYLMLEWSEARSRLPACPAHTAPDRNWLAVAHGQPVLTATHSDQPVPELCSASSLSLRLVSSSSSVLHRSPDKAFVWSFVGECFYSAIFLEHV